MSRYDTDKFETGKVEAYERMFENLRDKPIRLLEIGVWHGGSLQYFSDFFRRGRIIGMDLQPPSLPLPSNVVFRVADQNDSKALELLAQEEGPFDITIDDGSHTRKETLNCFTTLWPHVKSEGFYTIEDWSVGYHADPQFRGMVELVTEIILKRMELGISGIDLHVNNRGSLIAMRKR